MNLRVRLIVAFFLLSVVPLGAVTFYTYTSNATAIRVAAGREAQLLAEDLTSRMTLVTAQLSQQFERLMEIPASAQLQPTALSAAGAGAATPTQPSGSSATTPAPADAAPTKAEETTRVAQQLGEVAMLLNNIEVRGFGRGRGRFGASRNFPDNASRFGSGGRARDASPPGPPPSPPPSPPGAPSRGAFPDGDGSEGRGFSGSNDGRSGRGRGDDSGPGGGRRGFDGPPPPQPADPTRIQIDLGPVRRELLQQMFPDRERYEQLSPQERELILAKVNERMLGIQQGIQILQQKATEQAATAATAASGTSTSAPGQPSSAPAADAGANARNARTPPTPRTPIAAAAPAAAAAQEPAQGSTASGPLQRKTALSGTRMDVRVMQNGEVVGQVNAEINLPNLLATVFTTTRRDKGEVPFAVDKNGRVYTPTEADRTTITALNTSASRPDTPPGTELLPNWVVVTTADPTGAELKFGIARPLGGALDDLRRSSTRNAALGLGLIGLALIGIVPLSSRLTRNLSRLSDGVNRIASGDYRARVNVSSADEMGRLAEAFNRMAADVERHQRSAVAQERLRRELELGRKIQHDMLPQAPLRLGLTDIRGISVPASEVGGDFFNYFQTPSGRIALIVGDVSGKGVGAALLMANVQASLRTRLALGQDLASLARELDIDIGASTQDSVYATLFVGLLDPESRMLDYVNAGHNPQFVLRSGGGLEQMASTGLPIGLLAGREYGERRVSLAAGDVLFFYTDGCVEAENAADEMFGSARLEALLASRPTGSSEDVLARVEREIVKFRSGREPFDDATMMVVTVG